MPRRRTPEDRYQYKIRKQKKTLEEYAEQEIDWAENLVYWYSLYNKEMPEDEYRAYAFLKNREFLKKPGSLTLLYQMYLRCCNELPSVTNENAFDLLCYRFKMYAAVLKTGGYDGRDNW